MESPEPPDPQRRTTAAIMVKVINMSYGKNSEQANRKKASAHQHAVEYFKARGYDSKTAEKYARRHEAVEKVISIAGRIGSASVKRPSHPQRRRNPPKGSSGLGGSGMFHSDLMDTHI